MCEAVPSVGSIGAMRRAVEKNEPLSILRARLRLCVQGREGRARRSGCGRVIGVRKAEGG